MPNDDYKLLLAELNEVKTKIAIADFFISTFKQQDSDTLEKIELLKQRVDVIDAKLYNELKDIDRNITQRVVNVEQTVSILNTKLDNVSNNSFLSFTNNLDPKKWVLIITTVLSIMLGNNIVDNVVTDGLVKDPTKETIIQQLNILNQQLKDLETKEK